MMSKLSRKIIVPVWLAIAVIFSIFTVISYCLLAGQLRSQGLVLAETTRIGMENAFVARRTAEKVTDKHVDPQIFIDHMKEALKEDIGLTAVVTPAGKIVASSDNNMPELTPEIKAQLPAMQNSREVWTRDGLYNGKPVIYYLTALSNGSVLLLAVSAERLTDMRNIAIGLFLLTLVISACTGLLLTRMIVRPVQELQGVMGRVEAGDFSVRGRVKAGDEIGRLAGAFNRTLELIGQMIGKVCTAVTELNASSSKLIDVASGVAANSEEMTAKVSTVSTTVEQISANLQETAGSTEEVNANVDAVTQKAAGMTAAARQVVQTSETVAHDVSQVSTVIQNVSESIHRVASSADDVSGSMNKIAGVVQNINTSLQEISRSCERSIGIAVEAENRSQVTTGMIQRLNETARKINSIIEIIHSIAEQTNMLALNATIEAAGAGVAGKGFAVVAAEVKELAKRTGEETRVIAQQIQTMQTDMAEAVAAVEGIADVISETTSITRTIADAVTEQSKGVSGISAAISTGGGQLASISRDINEVAVSAEQVSKSADQASNGVRAMHKETVRISQECLTVSQNMEAIAGAMQTITDATYDNARSTQEIIENMREAEDAIVNMSEKAGNASEAAMGLGQLSDQLERLVKKFHT